jgi:hypothetical protein
MSISAYKNRKIPAKTKLCLICQLKTRTPVVEVHLEYDVSVQLCTIHASKAFMSMRRGRDFAVTIERAWEAANCLTATRRDALEAHRDQFRRRSGRRGRAERDKPGSYAWKYLRAELERRAAAGEPSAPIIKDLRDRHRHDIADMPSISTMRRWYRQARWRKGARTRVRAGFERRDEVRAGRAQREHPETRRLRLAYDRGDLSGRRHPHGARSPAR